MTENQKNQQKNDTRPGEIARRDFVALSVAGGLAVVETGVEIIRGPVPIRAC